MITWVMNWWAQRQRTIDIEIFWPTCCEYAADEDSARAAFFAHAMLDPAWRCLGETRIVELVGELPWIQHHENL